MISEQNRVFKRFLLGIDLCAVTISFFMGYILRAHVISIYGEIHPINEYIELLPVLLIIWWGLLHYFGMYKSTGIRQITEAFMISAKSAIAGFILFGSYVFILHKQEEVTRLFMGFTFALSVMFITLDKAIVLYIVKKIQKRGTSFRSSLFALKSILIVGTGRRAKKFIELIDKNPDWGLQIVGLVDIDPAKKGTYIHKYKVLGTFDEVPDIIHKNVIDEVVFIVPRSWLNKIEHLMLFCENEGLTVNVATDLFNLRFSKIRQTHLQDFPLLTFEPFSHEAGALLIKRIIDFTISGIGLVLFSPLFLLIGIIIRLDSKGPIFYKQERCGLYGRRFILYKFRTMIPDAESKLKELLQYNEMNGPVFKMTNDPRITRVGKWLRRFSIDELPQLWNVFRGDMSLVGPRPPLPSEVEKYDSWQRRKLSMRPGITCLWQISGRSEIRDFNEWMRLDLEYIDNWSLWLDFKILIKTVPVVLLAKGAK